MLVLLLLFIAVILLIEEIMWLTIAGILFLYLTFEFLVYFWGKDEDCRGTYGSITDKPSRESTDDKPNFYK